MENIKNQNNGNRETAISRFIGADEVRQILGVSRSKAYRIIKQLNNELEKKGKIVIAGKVSRNYFMESLGI